MKSEKAEGACRLTFCFGSAQGTAFRLKERAALLKRPALGLALADGIVWSVMSVEYVLLRPAKFLNARPKIDLPGFASSSVRACENNDAGMADN